MSGEKYGSILSQEEVEKVLEKNLSKNIELLYYEVKPASDNPLGFLGEHYKLSAEVTVGGQRKKVTYFVKKIPTQVPQHHEYAVKTGAFYKEVELYKTLFEDLKNAQKNLPQRTKWCPEFLHSRDSDLLVLEDLSAIGYYMYPERIYMDEEHVKASLRAMAAMHAASLVFEAKFNRGEVSTMSPEFKPVGGKNVTVGEMYAHLTFETEASDVKGHPGNTYHEAGIASQLKVVDLLPGYSADEKRLIQEKLPDILRHSLQLVKTSERFKNVFVHGDLWANNLLFRKDETGHVKDALIIDFQLARYAPPAHDIMMFLHLVQSKKFREDRQQDLLRYYHEEFSKELEKNSLETETLLPWATFLESCDFYDDLGLICKLFYFQLSIAPPSITGVFLATPENFTRNMLTDRSEMVVEAFLKDDICRTRVTEALNEVIKKFILP